MTNIKRLMYCTHKMADNACSLHCCDTADNNVKVHWHYRSPKCARPGRISGTLCLNAPFARVCENSYFYEMAHVVIKCRVTFGRKMFNDCIKPHSICMRLVLSTQEEFSLKRAHYGHLWVCGYVWYLELSREPRHVEQQTRYQNVGLRNGHCLGTISSGCDFQLARGARNCQNK